MTQYHVIVASEECAYVWQYRTPVSKLTSLDQSSSSGGHSLRHREGGSRERMFHIDDTGVNEGDTIGRKLTDFDIAKSMKRTDLIAKPTRFGIGTDQYMAPELLTQPPSAPGEECDVFSLGVTFLEVLVSDCDKSKLGILASRAGVQPDEVSYWQDIVQMQIDDVNPVQNPKRREILLLIKDMLSEDPKKRPRAKARK